MNEKNAGTLSLEQAMDILAGWINASERVVAFSGAGMSTESGISDFRSPGGIWSKYDPREMTYQKFLASEDVRRKRWKMFVEGSAMFEARPNDGHIALAELERLGKLDRLITQNIDGLHQSAGNSEDRVVEIHGTHRWVVCLDCGRRYPSEEVLSRLLNEDIDIPDCSDCGGILKTATISFGQPMPADEMAEAERASRNCDLFFVLGSTLVVQPANLMPVIAKQAGAKVVIINLSETAGDYLADMILRGKTGEILPLAVKRYREKYGAASKIEKEQADG